MMNNPDTVHGSIDYLLFHIQFCEVIDQKVCLEPNDSRVDHKKTDLISNHHHNGGCKKQHVVHNIDILFLLQHIEYLYLILNLLVVLLTEF